MLLPGSIRILPSVLPRLRYDSGFADQDFAGSNDNVIEGNTIFVGAGLCANNWRAAEQPHSRGCLKHIGRKGAALGIELDAQSGRGRDPLGLVGRAEHDYIRKQADDDALIRHDRSLQAAWKFVRSSRCSARERGEDNTTGRTLTGVGDSHTYAWRGGAAAHTRPIFSVFRLTLRGALRIFAWLFAIHPNTGVNAGEIKR